MFRNIFSNIHRLVYMAGEAPKGVEAQAAAALESDKASPEALKKEADELSKAIDDYVSQIESDINLLRSGDDRVSIKLDDPSSFENVPKSSQDVLQTLADAKAALKEGGATRGNLDFVRVKLDAAASFNRSLRAEGDPLAGSAEMRKVARAVVKPGEMKGERMAGGAEKEPEDWVQMTRLAENYRNEGDAARRAQLGLRIMDMAKKQMAGSEGVHEYAAGNTYLVVQPSERGNAFMFAYPMRIEGGKVKGWEHFALTADGKPASYDQFKLSPDDLLERYEKARA